jgi:hypothetical protein
MLVSFENQLNLLHASEGGDEYGDATGKNYCAMLARVQLLIFSRFCQLIHLTLYSWFVPLFQTSP